MGQTYQEWAAGHERRGEKRGERRGEKRGEKRGERRGERRGQARMLLLIASQRFGREAARQLENLVRSMGTKQLTQVGTAVVECETADELLAVASNGGAEVR